jgi:hypothetical protein
VPDDIVVFRIRSSDSRCAECGEEIAKGRLLRKEGERGLCLSCADLDELEFLPSGDTALTRRASKHSKLRAVVVEWNRSRKVYQRRGILVEPGAIARAEEECLGDEERRERQRMRAAERREEADAAYIARFAEAVARRYPGAGLDAGRRIAEHACRKYSGRVGRSAAAKELDAHAIDLAVQAHVRHEHTRYDDLLMNGVDRFEARDAVRAEVDRILAAWRFG